MSATTAPRWEYLVLDVAAIREYHVRDSGDPEEYEERRFPNELSPIDELNDEFRRFGRDGWELVAVYGGAAFFKRRLYEVAK